MHIFICPIFLNNFGLFETFLGNFILTKCVFPFRASEIVDYFYFLFYSYYPRFFTHKTCGKGEDIFCFSNEGICSKVTIQKPIMKWQYNDLGENVGFEQLFFPVNVGCCCQMIEGSVLEPFIY